MAKPKTPKQPKPTLIERLAVWSAPRDAWALAHRMRPDTGVSPAADALLALGYPRMYVPLDEPMPAIKDGGDLRKRYGKTRFVPREAVPRLYAQARFGDDAALAPPPVQLDEAVETVFLTGRPLNLYLLEIMFGSGAVVEASVRVMLGVKAQDCIDGPIDPHGFIALRALWAVMLRAPADVRTEARAQLEARYEAFRAELGNERWRTLAALDAILHGRAGVERAGWGYDRKLYLSEYVLADDDPAWVASEVVARLEKLKPADRETFDVQLAFVGGPTVLAVLRESAAKFHKDYKVDMDEQLALFA